MAQETGKAGLHDLYRALGLQQRFGPFDVWGRADVSLLHEYRTRKKEGMRALFEDALTHLEEMDASTPPDAATAKHDPLIPEK